MLFQQFNLYTLEAMSRNKAEVAASVSCESLTRIASQNISTQTNYPSFIFLWSEH